MTEYTVVGKYEPFKFGLASIDSIMQNIRIIVSTIVGMCPLDRTLGIDPSMIDQSTLAARALISSNILTAIQEQEPRAIVTEVTFMEEEEFEVQGKLVPIIKFLVNEEVAR
ncbi:GPW/gp25 family protein [Paenibacillus macquariensis]|uniref:IraD/Gp25-like domain-containing protein n=1 Tax=Paenibacillus macquariensis TaxID=948756 RepID=A0ABY1K715_9BACL|nr:GPW/gp25 family protein [Paenibacillus macquariensis]MEC0092508.1 GPW/gp25 family protein [Paenibacillus macquariensis]OAB35466.1 hypothetical protein PMSM_09425 [Paenibacillus macquariensis subsp. macquariensis]SIR35241.1 hypothetical protein SAMN05421578_111158 [Paenibacillus macquariensis]